MLDYPANLRSGHVELVEQLIAHIAPGAGSHGGLKERVACRRVPETQPGMVAVQRNLIVITAARIGAGDNPS